MRPLSRIALEWNDLVADKGFGLASDGEMFSGNFEIVTRFKAAAGATPGPTPITGKLRFQACNEKECLAPRTIDVRVTLDVQ